MAVTLGGGELLNEYIGEGDSDTDFVRVVDEVCEGDNVVVSEGV